MVEWLILMSLTHYSCDDIVRTRLQDCFFLRYEIVIAEIFVESQIIKYSRRQYKLILFFLLRWHEETSQRNQLIQSFESILTYYFNVLLIKLSPHRAIFFFLSVGINGSPFSMAVYFILSMRTL